MTTDLRCERHMHARLIDDVIEVRCHQCSKEKGHIVVHRWNAETGRLEHVPEPVRDRPKTPQLARQ